MAKVCSCNLKYISEELFYFFKFVSGYPVSVSGMITLPVSSSVYQTMVANIQQLHTNSDGTLCITPMQVQKNNQTNAIHTNHSNISTNTTTTSSSSLSCVSGNTQANNSSTVKYCRTILSNNSDTNVKTLGKFNNNRSNNNNSITSNNSDKYNCLMPKIEHADAQHSRAVVDNHGNITIHLGDGDPIKLECEIES